MPTKFSQFNNGGTIVAGDEVVGLRNGQNTRFAGVPPVPPLTSWVTLAAGQPLLINTGYFLNSPVPQNYQLPTVAAFGQLIALVNVNTGPFTIEQAAGQQIWFGNRATTLGVTGSIESLAQGDSLTLICFVPNTIFYVLGGAQGIWLGN